MKTLNTCFRFALALAATLACLGSQKTHAATTIHFGDYPDGTLVSAHNPYAGILDIQAAGGTDYGSNGVSWPRVFGTFWTESSIRNGVLEVMSSGAVPPDCYDAGQHYSRLTATFSQPVIGVSFDAWCYRPGIYSYRGLDAGGASFTGGGTILGIIDNGIPPGTWITYAPNIPSGGFLTEFHITNNDPGASSGAFWINDISFTVIPEPRLVTLLALATAGLLTLRRRRQ